jgi:hypothetical protein
MFSVHLDNCMSPDCKYGNVVSYQFSYLGLYPGPLANTSPPHGDQNLPTQGGIGSSELIPHKNLF